MTCERARMEGPMETFVGCGFSLEIGRHDSMGVGSMFPSQRAVFGRSPCFKTCPYNIIQYPQNIYYILYI